MYKILAKDGEARVGELTVKSGRTIRTPFFMPVCTKGTVKFVTSKDLRTTKTKAIISNAYLLSLRPGLEVLESAGGYKKFIDYEGINFTDSGGFQMIQPGIFVGVSNRGVHFNNPFDKQRVVMTPEKMAAIEEAIGADVAMLLDDVVPYGASYERAAQAVERTYWWAKRFLKTHSRKNQLVFAIAQGSIYPDLRKKSSTLMAELDVDGYALGGLAFGEPIEQTNEMIKISNAILPENKPRYVMGVGDPLRLLHAIEMGCDIFDSRFPTMNARHGRLFTRQGFLDLSKGRYKKDFTALDPTCDCSTCTTYTKAFLHHLLKTDEKTVHSYLSLHNIYFVQKIIEEAQKAIIEGRFKEYKEKFEKEWENQKIFE